jgi:hypothetical protein
LPDSRAGGRAGWPRQLNEVASIAATVDPLGLDTDGDDQDNLAKGRQARRNKKRNDPLAKGNAKPRRAN